MGGDAVKTFNLPWPSRDLSPNSRLHWAQLARAKKRYRRNCALIARTQGASLMVGERLHVHVRFVPPDRRRRDEDNMIAAMKSGLDGLADVLGIDDSRWRVTHEVVDDTLVGGAVQVEVGVE